jgi:hypothetical protein
MQIKETFDVSFPGAVESSPLEDVVVLADSAGVAIGVQRTFSARVRSVRDDGRGLIASRCVEIPLVGSDDEVSGILCHTGPRSDTRGVKSFADAPADSITVRTSSATACGTLIRIGNTGFAHAFPQLAAACEALPARISGCLVERATASDPHGQALKFGRQGYFTHDDDPRPERLIFNRIASLRESPGKTPTGLWAGSRRYRPLFCDGWRMDVGGGYSPICAEDS